MESFIAPPEDTEALKKVFAPPDDEEIKKAQKAREEFLRLFNLGARQKPEEIALALAVKAEQELRAFYEICPNQTVAAELAEALWKQGRYAEAAELDPSRVELARVLEEAEERPEDERCGCPDRYVEEQGQKVLVPRDYVVGRAWRSRRGEFGWILRCNTCGQINITSVLPPEVVALRARRVK